MLKFFRRIRKKGIDNGRLSKYLLYAFGEVILVTVGILIALQVNTWNEERKLNASADRSVELLYEEAQRIVSYLNQDYEMSQDRVESIDNSAKALFVNSLDGMDEGRFLEGVYLTPRFSASTPPRNVYDELKNSGRLSEIKSEELKKSISEYYAALDFFVSQLDYFRMQFENPMTLSEGGFRYTYDEDSPVKIGAWMDFEKLSANEAFKSAHVKALRDHIAISYQRRRLLDLAEAMRENLAKELGQTAG